MRPTLTFQGRLPGVVCQAALPLPPDDPLRLDVAGFVGFAERGPLDTPVLLEDASQYREVFGQDLAVAREEGRPVYAYLPGAVQAFFDNGGRRCYAVRVAGAGARPNRFRLPGLLTWNGDQGPRPVIAPAAWVGRWSDVMSVGTQLRLRPLRLAAPLASPPESVLTATGPQLDLEVPIAGTVRPGDLLRLEFAATGEPLLLFAVATVTARGPAVTTTRGLPITVTGDPQTMRAFTRRLPAPLPTITAAVRVRPDGGIDPLPAPLAGLFAVAGPGGDDYALDFLPPATNASDDPTRLAAGDLLRLTTADGAALTFPVAEVDDPAEAPASPPNPPNQRAVSRLPLPQPLAVERLGEDGWEPLPTGGPSLELRPDPVSGQPALYLPPPLVPGVAPSLQVGDTLRVTCEGGVVLWLTVGGLGWRQETASPPSAPDQQVVADMLLWEAPGGATGPYVPEGEPAEVDLLSFDLTIREGPDVREAWSELGFSPGPGYWRDVLVAWADGSPAGPPQLPPNTSARLRVPLADPDYPAPFFLPLGMDELPGADTWAVPLPDNGASGKDGLDIFTPESLFLDAALATTGARDLVNEADFLLYLSPTPRLLRGLHSLLPIDEVALIAVPDLVHRPWPYAADWPAEPLPPPPPPPPPPDLSCFQVCAPPLPPSPPAPSLPEHAPCPEPFNAGPPDLAPPDLPAQIGALPALAPPARYDMAPLLAVQQAMINLAAGRADQVAVLSLPGHFGTRETLDWQSRLTGIGAMYDGTPLTYAAVYHPWLQYREEVTPQLAPLRATPPDGAVCGMIAARERTRSAWIAPANIPLRGVVGLTPALTAGDWTALFDRAINLLHRQPGAFSAWSAHTLSLDPLLVQLSVRRLLIYLRKLCLRRGMRYVFESNNERFRQRVQAGFEATLNDLMNRGALTAFVVSTGADLNTPNDRDNGRFLIALKIAPTLPIEFITIVLLRAGESLLQVIER